MKYYIYILHSQTSDIHYIGYSSNPFRRTLEHNTSLSSTFTSKHRPWDLRAVYCCGVIEAEAIKMERFIKRQKSRGFIEKLITGVNLTGNLAQLIKVPHVRD